MTLSSACCSMSPPPPHEKCRYKMQAAVRQSIRLCTVDTVISNDLCSSNIPFKQVSKVQDDNKACLEEKVWKLLTFSQKSNIECSIPSMFKYKHFYWIIFNSLFFLLPQSWNKLEHLELLENACSHVGDWMLCWPTFTRVYQYSGLTRFIIRLLFTISIPVPPPPPPPLSLL